MRPPRGRRRPRRWSVVCVFAALFVVCALLPAYLFHISGAAAPKQLRGAAGAREPRAAPPPPPRADRRLAMVVPYVGSRLPSYFKLFASSCRASSRVADYLVLVSDPAAIPKDARDFLAGRGDAPPWLPGNVRFEAVGVNRFARLHARIPAGAASFGDPFPDDAELEPGSLAAVVAGTFARNPRHLVEFKPAIGVVFREYLEPYSHWAFGDLDVLMGDVEAFVDGDEWDDFDVVAYSFGDQWRAYTRGQWTMHRNAADVNVAYLRCNFLGPRLRKRLEDEAHYESCEGCYSTAVAAARLRTKFVVKHFTDAANKGDRDAAWVTADGQVRRCLGGGAPCRPLAPRDGAVAARAAAAARGSPWRPVARLDAAAKRCMSWVNPAYQNCLAGGDYGALDTIVLDGAGRYARSTLPRDPYARQDGGFAAAAFFHFQEWKKKWKSFSGHGHGGLPGALLATRYGVVPVPPLEPGGAAAAVRDRLAAARSLEYCAFKACGDARPAFARDDLLWAYAGPGDGGLRAGDGPFAAHRAAEHRPALVVAASFLDDGAQDALETIQANGCGWTGPLVLAAAVARGAAFDALVGSLAAAWARCAPRADFSTLVLALVDGSGDALRALKNVGLDNSPARRDVVAPAAARLSAGAADAVAAAAARAAPGATLVLPQFRVDDETALESLGALRAAVDGGAAAPGAADGCARGGPGAAAPAAVAAWLAGGAVAGGAAAVFPPGGLDAAAPGAALAVDAVDSRGDRRLARDLEEARRPRCFDGLLHRSIAAHDGAATFALVPGAFVAGLGEPAGDCGCQADADAPSKKQRDAVDAYAAFLDRAARARADAEAERRARSRR